MNSYAMYGQERGARGRGGLMVGVDEVDVCRGGPL